MIKNITLSLFTICILLIILEVSLRFAGFKAAYFGEEKFILSPKHNSFNVKDNVLGWRLGVGEFEFLHADTVYFKCMINERGNRVINQNDGLLRY